MKAHELAKRLLEFPEDAIVVTRSDGDVFMSVDNPVLIKLVDTESKHHKGICYYDHQDGNKQQEKWHEGLVKYNGVEIR